MAFPQPFVWKIIFPRIFPHIKGCGNAPFRPSHNGHIEGKRINRELFSVKLQCTFNLPTKYKYQELLSLFFRNNKIQNQNNEIKKLKSTSK